MTKCQEVVILQDCRILSLAVSFSEMLLTAANILSVGNIQSYKKKTGNINLESR